MKDADPVIFKMMAQEAMRQATEQLALQAEEFAMALPTDATGQFALTAFANAIRAANSKLYGERQ